MSLLEEAASRGSFRTEVNYHGRELTARERQLCHLYRIEVPPVHAYDSQSRGVVLSYNTDALVAHTNRAKAPSAAMPLICNGLGSEGEPDSLDGNDI